MEEVLKEGWKFAPALVAIIIVVGGFLGFLWKLKQSQDAKDRQVLEHQDKQLAAIDTMQARQNEVTDKHLDMVNGLQTMTTRCIQENTLALGKVQAAVQQCPYKEERKIG